MTATSVSPHNRLQLNYRDVPAQKIHGPIFDAHMHANNAELTKTFIEAADLYGIRGFHTMTALENVDGLNAAFPGRFRFIAVPKWQDAAMTDAFESEWLRRLDAFYDKGARLFKLHMAPGTKNRWKMDFEHPLIRRVIEHAYARGYHFMTHVGDPKGWFAPGKAYADTAVFNTFESQFLGLERLLAEFPDRIHLAHMGGCLEDPTLLAARLDKYPNYILDSSATKWIVRAVAEQNPENVRNFIVKYQDRILFGSDIVVGDKFDFDHYASRYWVHLMQWETAYRGESPIDDPDATPPRIAGLDLPPEVLEKLYWKNAERWLPVG